MARTKGKGRRKPLALQPLKTGKFNLRKMLHQGDRKSQALQPKKTQEFKQPQMHHLGSGLKTENPCLDIVLAAGEASLPPCPYKTPLSSRTASIRKTMNKTSRHYLNKRKLEALSTHFNPIPFVREKPSHFATHRLLLSRLGLWNFLHLDFGQNIHSDLIKQLIVYYNPKKPAGRRSHVNGCPVLISRATLARALSLPSKRLKLDAAITGPLVVSEEEAMFLEELLSSWLVLQDDGCELPAEVLKVKSLIREKRPEDVDWAELIWFMVRNELLKGAKLVNCHYASHMQLLLKNQKPRLFGDHVEIVKGLEKQRILGLGDNAVAVEESSSERNTESTQEWCSKWRNSSPVQCEEGSTSYQQSALQKEDGNGELKLLGGDGDGEDDEIKWTVTEELFVGNSSELLDCLEKKSNVDLEFNKKKEWQGELAELEFGSSSDVLMNEPCNDERLKMENSGDFTASGRHMDLDAGHDNGEKEFALDDLVENCKTISEKLCISDELHVLKMEIGNKELKLLPDEEDKRKPSNELACAELPAEEVKGKNIELKLLNHEDARELSEGLGKEELFDRKTGDFIDSQGKEVSNDSEGKQMEQQLESVSANSMLMNEESNEERLKVEGSNNLSMSEKPHHGMQEMNFHKMDLVFSDDKCEAKYGLNVLAEYQNVIEGETSTSDDQQAIETEDENMKMIKCEEKYGLHVLAEYQNAIDGETFTSGDPYPIEREYENRKGLQNELPEGSIENEQINGKAGEFLESQEKKGDYNSKEHEMEMREDGDYEKEFSQELVKEELIHDNQEVEICFPAEKGKPEQLSTAKPEANGLNEIRLKSSSFVEPFAVVEQEIMFTNLDYSTLDTSLKREEIDCWNVTNSVAAAAADDDDQESYDLDLCSNQVQLWMSRLKNAVQNQMDNGKENEMLVKELETMNKMLEESEKRRRQEQQRYQKDIRRLEREVFLMKNILDEYRTALYEVDKSFAEYRRRTQLPAHEEQDPIYVDHPDGGGNVVLATELIRVQK